MRPVVITTPGGAANTAAVPLDQYLTPFQVTVACVVNGTVAYSLQYTYDDVFNVAAGSVTWWTDSAIPVGTVANAETTYDNPIKAVRLSQASGAGTVTMTVNQAGVR